jgi:hypothetical protein
LLNKEETMDKKKREEFDFYKKQLEVLKDKGRAGIMVSVTFLDAILQQNEELRKKHIEL